MRLSCLNGEDCNSGESSNSREGLNFYKNFETEKTLAVHDHQRARTRRFFNHAWTVYEKGGFYRRHLDAFEGDDARVLSVVIYLNSDVLPDQGGQLLLHTSTPQRIEARGGTLVAFLSHDIEHEVLESRRQRRSFAGWFGQRKIC